MRPNSINERRRDRNDTQQIASAGSALNSYMLNQFQSVLSTFAKASLSETAPIQGLASANFLQQTSSVSATNTANLETVPNGQPASVSLSEMSVTASSAGPQPKYQDIVQQASRDFGVPVALVNAVIRQESGFNARAVSPVGAQGLMQLMPATGKAYGCTDAFDPTQNIRAGTQFLSELLTMYKGDVNLALAGYNAGPGNVAKYGGQIPPFKETQNYVAKVSGYYASNLSTMEHSGKALAEAALPDKTRG